MRDVDASVTRNVSVRIRVAHCVMGGQAILCKWPREFMGAYGSAYMPTQYVCAHVTGQKNSPLPKGERSKARF